MAIEIGYPVKNRQGTITTPSKKINTALARQTVKCTVQIDPDDREDETKSISFALERSTNNTDWEFKAGFVWRGQVPTTLPPGVPDKPYQDPGIIVTLAENKGYYVRIHAEIPNPVKCGLTIESI